MSTYVYKQAKGFAAISPSFQIAVIRQVYFYKAGIEIHVFGEGSRLFSSNFQS